MPKTDKNYAKLFGDEHDETFYDHHYGSTHHDSDHWRPDFHHEQLEWPVHEKPIYEDKFWTYDHHYEQTPTKLHHLVGPYEETHTETQERELFE